MFKFKIDMTHLASGGKVSEPKNDTLEPNLIVYSTRLPGALVKRLKHLAIDKDRSVRSLIEEAIGQYLDREESKRSRR
jgi:hypothetical protein